MITATDSVFFFSNPGASAYSVSRRVEQIQNEIMTNGPVEASLDVYADFLTYKSGNQPSSELNSERR